MYEVHNSAMGRVGHVKLPESSEWVLHCAASLAQLPEGQSATTRQLAEHFGLPGPYLAKQLAHLVRAGVLAGSTGPRGGFRLARPPEETTVLHIVEAVDGAADPYQCRELRQQGRGALPPEACAEPCVLAQVMRRAHDAWRSHLASVTLADVISTLSPETLAQTRRLLDRGEGAGERG